ncbi:3553_t:CDS:2 [Cetraspora pellucida]|uniref:3553_t:CDS:1 n=1 Tax=Cetraspora pellucida TaxID=1433469 RepID=A0ACA9KV71_9GLOM|nr:3553_t:CDS:2 [Cetraspora pellucida]
MFHQKQNLLLLPEFQQYQYTKFYGYYPNYESTLDNTYTSEIDNQENTQGIETPLPDVDKTTINDQDVSMKEASHLEEMRELRDNIQDISSKTAVTNTEMYSLHTRLQAQNAITENSMIIEETLTQQPKNIQDNGNLSDLYDDIETDTNDDFAGYKEFKKKRRKVNIGTESTIQNLNDQ